jgi:hypothetical protein
MCMTREMFCWPVTYYRTDKPHKLAVISQLTA